MADNPVADTQGASTTPVTATRRYPAAPLVGVAAAVFNEQGAVLLVKRGRPPGAGNWGLPGGLLDLGEQLVDGARREVREECNVECEVMGLVAAFEPIQRDGEGRIEYHYVVLDYWARYLGGEAVAQDDAAAVAWVRMQELDGYRLRPDSRAVVEKAFVAWRTQDDSSQLLP